SYRRPSGHDIHKWKDAQESDDWGVRPDAGLEVLLTNRQNELVIGARRKRDFLSWEALEAAADQPTASQSESNERRALDQPPTPTADPDTKDAAASPSQVETEAAAAAKKDPATIDPQLHKAIEYLQSKTSDRPPQPARA